MKFVRLNSTWDTALWTFRSWKRNYRLPNDPERWSWLTEDDTWDNILHGLESGRERWSFLAPFFSFHNLFIYDYTPSITNSGQPPAFPEARHSVSESWPWARRAYGKDEDIYWTRMSQARVWAARDACGHEVVIRLSSGSVESDELKVLRRLDSPIARNNPKNPALPLLKTLSFDGLIFTVTPRWYGAPLAAWITFSTISELFDMAEFYYEGLAFLHDLRIAHRDICNGNAVMNLLAPVGEFRDNLRKKGDVRYALIDFETSIAFPEDTNISEAQTERVMRWSTSMLGLEPGLCNPFKDDVLSLTITLERTVRVAQPIIPEIGTFFDSILGGDYVSCPTAQEALGRLRKVIENSTNAKLEQPPTGLYWDRASGKISS